MCRYHVCRFIKKPNPSIFFYWCVYSTLGRDLYQVGHALGFSKFSNISDIDELVEWGLTLRGKQLVLFTALLQLPLGHVGRNVVLVEPIEAVQVPLVLSQRHLLSNRIASSKL